MTDATLLRQTLDAGDASGLSRLLAEDPELASRQHKWRAGCRIGPCQPIGYLAQARFNGYTRHIESAALTRLLLAAGAPVNGNAGDGETPLITAVSYGEAAVTQALIEAGANLEATGYAVPSGTALAHAIEFGAPHLVDMLIAAGARVRTLREAAGAGDLGDQLALVVDQEERAQALRAAALCGRLAVIDELLAAGVPVAGFISGGTALHWAAWMAQAESVRHLLARGADASLQDPAHQGTPAGWARHRVAQCPYADPAGHAAVIALLDGSAV